MEILILLFVLVLLISFLCSILESILLSLNLSYISVIYKKNKSIGTLLKKLKTNIDQSIASILILNTMANTLGATAIGIQAQNVFGHDSNFILVTTILLTFLILFVAEIIPKTIGVIYWKELAPMSAVVLQFFVYITYPIIVLTLFVTRKISKNKDTAISREELLHSTLLSEEDGVINDMESDIIENTLNLKQIKIADILTPRSVVFAVDKKTKIKDLLDDPRTYKFSRVPVYDGNIDNIVGVVLTKKLFKQAIKDKEVTIEKIMIDINNINENIPVSKVLSSFIKAKGHILIVVDGYDQTEGIVTLEDCIETLLGLEIMDELDTTEDMRALASNNMKMKRKNIKLNNTSE